jgi:o-succinylbenzoate synthase
MVIVSLANHQLNFSFPAGTSRGVYTTHNAAYIRLNYKGIISVGEAAPLLGLSPESFAEAVKQLTKAAQKIQENQLIARSKNEAYQLAAQLAEGIKSVQFALETCLLGLLHSSERNQQLHFVNDFSTGNKSILINGLIWMGDRKLMLKRIEEKIEAGFKCLKMKVGAIDFQEELDILKSIRNRFSAEQLTLRVDANGAFSPEEALVALNQLAKLHIHSIEQPIKAGQLEAMRRLCQESHLPIALDEELITPRINNSISDWLSYINPQYIILKPTLVGGLANTERWIEAAEQLNIGWWLTSALESNVGLNTIAQFAANYPLTLPQGLGTGQLYTNNISSPLSIIGENLHFRPNKNWNFEELNWQLVSQKAI